MHQKENKNWQWVEGKEQCVEDFKIYEFVIHLMDNDRTWSLLNLIGGRDSQLP